MNCFIFSNVFALNIISGRANDDGDGVDDYDGNDKSIGVGLRVCVSQGESEYLCGMVVKSNRENIRLD